MVCSVPLDHALCSYVFSHRPTFVPTHIAANNVPRVVTKSFTRENPESFGGRHAPAARSPHAELANERLHAFADERLHGFADERLQYTTASDGEEGIRVEDWIASIGVLGAMAEWERRELPVAAGACADSRCALEYSLKRRGRQRQPGVVHVLAPHDPGQLDQYVKQPATRERKAPCAWAAEVRDNGGRWAWAEGTRRAAWLNHINVVHL